MLSCASTICGCGHDPNLTRVEGTVTVGGKLLGKGSISFEPADGVGPTAGATIEEGKYTAKAPPGRKRVRITGFEVVGQVPAYPDRPDSPMRDIVKDVVPDAYNVKSELIRTIESSADTEDFALE